MRTPSILACILLLSIAAGFTAARLSAANKTDADKTDANKTDADKTDADKTDADKTDADKTETDKPAAETGQHPARLEAAVKVSLNYLLYLPEDYDQQKKWPVLLFLHGAGERGDDLDLVKFHGPPKLIAAGKQFPFIVVSPQCKKDRWWEPIELTALLDEIVKTYRVDEDRIYVTGLSMGGFGTWELAAHTPHRFAAIAPICGGGEKFWVRNYPHLPTWAFHGAKDTAVPLERSQIMIDELKKEGGQPKLTIYPDAGHNSWTRTYNNPELYEWLLGQAVER